MGKVPAGGKATSLTFANSLTIYVEISVVMLQSDLEIPPDRISMITAEESMSQTRKHFTAAEKMAILRRHLLEQVPVSDLCDEYGIHPTLFYRWQKQLFENGAAAFEYRPKSGQDAASKKITALEEKLVRKNEVLSELMEEHIKLEKALDA